MPVTLAVENGNYIFHGTSLQTTKDKNQLLAPLAKQLLNYGVMIILQPNGTQANRIDRTNGCSRLVANDYLDAREKLYQDSHQILSVSAYKKNYLPALKQEKPFLCEVDKFALESACEDIDNAFRHFYAYVKKHGAQKKHGGLKGYPKHVSRFDPNGNSYATKFTNSNIKFTQEGIQLPKLGVVKYRTLDSARFTDIFPEGTRITRVTVRRDGCRYTASLQMERVIDLVQDIKTLPVSRIYGGDAGIKDFLIYGSQEFTEKAANPRHLEVHSRRLRLLQKSLSRKQYDPKAHHGSNNWKRAKARVHKEMRRVANMRKDFLHQLSTRISRECDVFIREDLNIQGMVKNRHLARAVSSVGWGMFFDFLQYKLERKGGCVIKIGRFYPSSKLCNVCGHKKADLQLKDRSWVCPECGTCHDRDVNAKQNILDEGIRILLERGYRITDQSGNLITAKPQLAA